MALIVSKISLQKLKTNKAFADHKFVYKFSDPTTGLVAYISIHSLKRGSAVGGTRFFPYKNENEAITDVLNLSKSMTYKCAIAGIAYGGGKGVIIGDPKSIKNPDLLTSYAKAVKKLKGKFYTGEDVGLDEADVQFMLSIAPYFIGKSDQAGDPSEYASLSVYTLIRAGAKKVFGTSGLSHRSIAIKGLGKVGLGLIKLLAPHKPNIIIADIDGEAIIKAKVIYPNARVVTPEEITTTRADIYAPCALGNEFERRNVEKIKAKLICGGANNQITEKDVVETLAKRGILYIPDYLANAGGLINVADELEKGGYKRTRVLKRIEHLQAVFNNLYKLSQRLGKTLSEVTNSSVENKILS